MLRTSALLALLLSPLASSWGQVPVGKKYAVLIGVKEYNHSGFSNLYWTERDATELGKVLKSAGFEVVLLTDSEGKANDKLAPTKANILTHLDKVLDRCGRNDMVLFGFAGHGLQFKNEDKKQQGSYFCPYDAHPNRSDTLISFRTLYDKLEDCGAGVKLVMVDACRVEVDKERFRSGVDAESAPPPPRGVSVLFSCKSGQAALELNDLKHGLFFFHVLEGLRGKAVNDEGYVSWQDIAGYAARKVGRSGYRQIPVLKGEIEGEPILIAAGITPTVPEIGKQPKAGDETSNSLGMKLVYIPSGEFTMGSPASEQAQVKKEIGLDSVTEEKQHKVRITKGFYLGKYTVTQAEYQSLIGQNPSYFSPTGGGKDKVAELTTSKFPVETVSLDDAKEFCKKLSQKEGKKYRLPTEAEWEYACRAGTKSAFHFDETRTSDQANYDGNYPFNGGLKGEYRMLPTSVGSFAANAWGLCDMHGNVYQWCEDWYAKDYYDNSPVDDPKGPSSGFLQVVRGGCWHSSPIHCRSAARRSYSRIDRYGHLGFRVVLEVR